MTTAATLSAPSAVVFEHTPLAAFATNATFLFENTALAPRTAELYAAFNRFFTTDKLWLAFAGDNCRYRIVCEMWNSVTKTIPMSGLISPIDAMVDGFWHIGAAYEPFNPFHNSTTKWPQRGEMQCMLAIISCLGELQEEMQARPDILAKPLPTDVPIKIDHSTQVSLTLRELFGMALGATLVRADADPRLSGVGLINHKVGIHTLTLLAAALEGEPPLLSPDNIKIVANQKITLVLPIGAVMTACQRAYAAYTARARATEGLELY